MRFAGATASGAPSTGTFLVGDFVIDQTGAVWICVVAGSPGTWTCSTKSAAEQRANVLGIKFEPFPVEAGAAQTAPTTQTAYGIAVWGRAGTVITGIKIKNAVAAAGTPPTNAKFGLADATGKIVALSAAVAASGNWTVGTPAFAFTATYTLPTDGIYFPCFVVNGVWGTTQPTPRLASSGSGADLVADGSNPPVNFSWTGQTDLPAINSSLTITSGATRSYYLALY